MEINFLLIFFEKKNRWKKMIFEVMEMISLRFWIANLSLKRHDIVWFIVIIEDNYPFVLIICSFAILINLFLILYIVMYSISKNFFDKGFWLNFLYEDSLKVLWSLKSDLNTKITSQINLFIILDKFDSVQDYY